MRAFFGGYRVVSNVSFCYNGCWLVSIRFCLLSNLSLLYSRLMDKKQKEKLKELRSRWTDKNADWSALDRAIVNNRVKYAQGDFVFFFEQPAIVRSIEKYTGVVKVWVIAEQREMDCRLFHLGDKPFKPF